MQSRTRRYVVMATVGLWLGCGDGAKRPATTTPPTPRPKPQAVVKAKPKGWTLLKIPVVTRLRAIAGSSAADVHIAAWDEGTIIHYDGRGFSSRSLNRCSINTISFANPGFMAGGCGSYGPNRLLALSRGGWKDIAGVPKLKSTINQIARCGNDMMVAGGSGILLRRSGTRWRRLSLPEDLRDWDIDGVWCRDATDFFVFTTGGAQLWQHRAGTWSRQLKHLAVGSQPLAIWGSGRDVFVSTVKRDIWRYGSAGWQRYEVGVEIYGGWRTFAVGQRGTILRFERNAWKTVRQTGDATLYAVWGTDDVVFAVGANGVVLRNQR